MYCFAAFVLLSASPQSEQESLAIARIHSANGRCGKAETLLRKLSLPKAKAGLALMTAEDTTFFRRRGVTSFDRSQADKLAREVLPTIARGASSDLDCAFTLGMFYHSGLGVKTDLALAEKWLQYAAARKHPRAMCALALIYRDGNQSILKDPHRAFELAKKAADAGNSYAMVVLGEIYEEGEGVPRNPVMAFKCYENAAKTDSVDGMIKMAVLYLGRLGRALVRVSQN
jgi:TPR repeat protein